MKASLYFTGVSVMVLALSVAGCGGGGDGGPISTPPPAPSPLPSPAPTPTPATPTPVPSPTPTPPASNTDLLGPLATQSFGTNASIAEASYGMAGNLTSATSESKILSLAYDAPSGTYTISVSETGGRSQVFRKEDIDVSRSNAEVTVYSRTTATTRDTLTLSKPGTSGRFQYQYVGTALWKQEENTANGVDASVIATTYGFQTSRSGTIPRSGAATYEIDLIGAGTGASGLVEIRGTGQFDIDFAKNAFALRASTDGFLPSSGTFVATGVITTGRVPFINGTASLSGGGTVLSGSLTGEFYGPDAAEIGGTWNVNGGNSSDTVSAAGTVMGRRQADLATATQVSETSGPRQFYKAAIDEDPDTPYTGTSATVYYDPSARQYSVIIPSETYYGSMQPRIVVNGPDAFGPSTGATGTRLHTGVSNPLNWVRSGEIIMPIPASQNAPATIARYAFVYGLPVPDSAVPRAGSATFALDFFGVVGDDAGLNGTGKLKADLSRATYSLNGDLQLSRLGSTVDTGTLFGNGTIGSSASLRVDGSVDVRFASAGTFSGSMRGDFYGPEGQELGANIRAGNQATGRTLLGTVIGARTAYDPSPTVPPVGDVNYTSSGFSAYLHSPALGAPANSLAAYTGPNGTNAPSSSYDAASARFTVTPSNPNGDPAAPVTFGAAQRDASASDANFDVYRVVQAGTEYTARVLKTDNTQIAMTYAGFVGLAAHVGGATPGSRADDHDDFAFSLFDYRGINPVVPTSGSAAYTGVLFGNGVQLADNSSKTLYDLTGTAQFRMDFTNVAFTGQLTINGKHIDTGATTAFGSFDYTGAIAGKNFDATGYGGALHGSFFGPQAQEVAGVFATDQTGPGTRTSLEGAFLAK